MAKDYVKYQSDYIRDHLRQIMVKISKEKEADLIEWLESKESMQAYIKDLIRQDMEKNSHA